VVRFSFQHPAAPLRLPRPLVPGDAIALVTPSRFADDATWEAAAAAIRAAGFTPVLPPAPSRPRDGSLGGSDAERAAALNAAFRDPSIRAVWALRGGYGAARLLPLLDPAPFRADPTWIVGFSDITALHAWAAAQGVGALHASVALTLDRVPPADRAALWTALVAAAPLEVAGVAGSEVAAAPLEVAGVAGSEGAASPLEVAGVAGSEGAASPLEAAAPALDYGTSNLDLESGAAAFSAAARRLDPESGAAAFSAAERRLDPESGAAAFSAAERRLDPESSAAAFSAAERRLCPVTGGNLSVLYSLLGTPWFPEVRGRWLFLEDLDEYMYHLDRMFCAFRLAGVFEEVAGVALGGFTELQDHEVPFGRDLAGIVQDHVPEGVPVVWGVPAGHGDRNAPLVLGAPWEPEEYLRTHGNAR
jgi:muramoyltetrapeptide carboxypeptidase LdcA involved in peptidoglycan recycling